MSATGDNSVSFSVLVMSFISSWYRTSDQPGFSTVCWCCYRLQIHQPQPSACTSGSLDPSHVLLAIGLPHEVAHGSLRLSLSEYNTQEEVDYVLEELPKIVTYLRNMSPVWDELEKGEKKHVI